MKRLRSAIPIAALCLSALAQTTPPKHGMTLDDLLKFLRVGNPVLSPDGQWIAYTVSHVDVAEDKNITDLWMVSWDGKQDIQLTRGKESADNPRWSPEGKFLSFTSSREGEAKGSQVWFLDRRGGEAQQLTNVKESLGPYRWSPDSKQLLLTLTVKEEPESDKGAKPKPPKPIVLDRFHFKQDQEGYLSDRLSHLYLFDIATKKLTKLTSAPVSGPGSYAEGNAEWSPDGKQIAFVSNQSTPDPDRVNNSDIFVVNASPASVPSKLTTFTGRDEGPVAWTPDSKQIVYRQGITPHYAIYDMPQMAVVPATGGAPELLAPGIKLDQWVAAPVLSSGGKSILTDVADDRQQYIAEIPLGNGTVRRLTAGEGIASALDEAAGHLALLWTTDATAPEIYALEAGKLRKITTP